MHQASAPLMCVRLTSSLLLQQTGVLNSTARVISPPLSGGGTSRVSGTCTLKIKIWKTAFHGARMQRAGHFLVFCFCAITKMTSLFVCLLIYFFKC